MRARRRSAAVVLGLALCTLVAGCSGGDDTPEPTIVTRTLAPAALTFGVYGSAEEITAYQRVANSYNAVTDESDVTLASYGTEKELLAAIDAGTVPDVFLLSRNDLPDIKARKLNRPLGALLDERGVDFGDGYSRAALEAFSSDLDLQCMPYGIAPDVVFYNKRWIDFDKMQAQDISAPTLDPDSSTPPRWSFDQFAAAAEFGTRPRRNVRGLYIDPTVRGLAPFIYSGGGDLFDDDTDPTSLSFSDGSTRDALTTVLPLLRNPLVNLTSEQLAEATPLQWFKRGKLGMMVGNRSLLPELRATTGLDFDVMPMPVLDDSSTVGEFTGICLSSKASDTTEAADFLASAISTDSVRQVVAAGALSPANQQVALSEEFLEPDLLPQHGAAFVATVRNIVIPPLLAQPQALLDAVGPDVASLITSVLPPDIDAITSRIDELSRTVLDPGSASPSASPTD